MENQTRQETPGGCVNSAVEYTKNMGNSKVIGYFSITPPANCVCDGEALIITGSHARPWQTLRRLLSTHRLVTTRLPLSDRRVINIRKSNTPEDEQKRVYQMLGINWETAFPTRKTEIPA